ncbi:MAG: thiamine-phosphate kinase [Gallionellales bacterium RIFCSPLOWO2_12_FULL_59_22]|nr:MAG: thiamine-phosphate kinase [Gallionellales bacterium RIFCSPLOWO2_02_FULL_59_110]OGT02567.1 MAG: thiamine-phosphate kinase [Gallionellales bacterium RIFCSPLOWO2_02_58_13]OGT11235.1 MAG: thiamine-phosphate kinase [Gallionellales bacterium RIFCSPLOWO2_12_FULL_59_22]
MGEFDLIKRYFTRATPSALLGIGDDAALLRVNPGNVLAVSTDMLVCGTHFLPDADPFLLGHKTLAVNLSDLAAMGAEPRWAVLAIALPEADEAWLAQFSAGFFALAQQHGVELVGGDTTRGPLNLCVTIFGDVPAQQALRRSGAQVGDDIWVSGRLGDAALALAHLQGRIVLPDEEIDSCAPALHQPQPRVALGLALRGIASSAIDISDGLLADLGHILDASQVGAEIDFAALPLSPSMQAHAAQPLVRQCILAGGDDYELCFTAPAARHEELADIAARLDVPLTRIGKVVAGRGCIVRDAAGNPLNVETGGYEHFR